MQSCAHRWAAVGASVAATAAANSTPEPVISQLFWRASSIARAASHTGAVARYAAQQTIVFDEDADPDVTIELLDSVTFAEVREVAAGIADELSVAVVGPHTLEELETA